MADRYLRCDRCGKMNPNQARTCLDCGTILQRPTTSDDATAPGHPKRPSSHIEKSDGFDAIAAFYEENEPLESMDGIRPLSAVERIERDESQAEGELSGIERLGADRRHAPEPEEVFEKSRAFEVESSTWLDEPEEEPEAAGLSDALETFDEAAQRTGAESSAFQEAERARASARPKTAAKIEERAAPAPDFSSAPTRIPRHRKRWERSDVEIMASIRRRTLVQGLLGRSLPLVATGLALAVAGWLFVFPVLLPGGTWGGRLVDQTGDSKIVQFTMKLHRRGNALSGTFWLTPTPGAAYSPDVKMAVPLSLEGIYAGRPIPVSGRFDRRTLLLALHPANAGPGDATLQIRGVFMGDLVKAESISPRNVKTTWDLSRKRPF